jgi:hypothetical protein
MTVKEVRKGMNAESRNTESGAGHGADEKGKRQIVDVAKAVGAILGVPLALFAIASNMFDQPLVAMAVALTTAILASIWVVYTRWTGFLEVVVAWLALMVVVLAGVVIWPRTMTVEGTIRDTAGNPVRNEVILLFDRSGKRYETKTDVAGYYHFTDVPTGNYRVQVRGNEVEGGTKGILVRVVQQNMSVPGDLPATETPSPTPTEVPPSTPTPSLAPTDTPTPTVTDTPPPSDTDTPTPIPTSIIVATPTNTPTPELQVYVSNVKDGDTVAQSLTLLGKYAPEVTEDIWVFVEFRGTYWPQSPNACEGESVAKIDGLWEVRAGVGGSEDEGKLFEVILTAADEQASQFIAQTLQTWCQNNEYPGLIQNELPVGLTTYEHVTVRRGPQPSQPHPDISNIELPGQVFLEGFNNNDTVPQILSVEGAYSNEVIDHIWVLVYPPNGRYYPQSTDACAGISTVQSGGLWQADISLGGEGDAGKPFDIIVVLANEEANAVFERRQEIGCQTGSFPGLLFIELPQGIDEKASVSVIRE